MRIWGIKTGRKSYVVCSAYRCCLLVASRLSISRPNIRHEIADDGQHVEGLKTLVTYIIKQWINKRSVGPERLNVPIRDNHIWEF